MAQNMITLHPDRPNCGLQAIGYWRPAVLSLMGIRTPDRRANSVLPWPGDFVDPQWDPDERGMVLLYVEQFGAFSQQHVRFSWRGYSTCRICGARNGSVCISDGTFVWPEGFAHYIREHQVRPPPAFVEHCRRASSPVR